MKRKSLELSDLELLLLKRLSQFGCLNYELIQKSCIINNKKLSKDRIQRLVEYEYIRIVEVIYKGKTQNCYKLASKGVQLVKQNINSFIYHSNTNPHDLAQAEFTIINFSDCLDYYITETQLIEEFNFCTIDKMVYSVSDGCIQFKDKRLYIETITNYYGKEQKNKKYNFKKLVEQNGDKIVFNSYKY